MNDTDQSFRVHLPAREIPAPIDAWAPCSDPREIVRRAGLSIAEKREILSSWASDARAVPDAPALRRLDNGEVVGIDDILAALQALDRDDYLQDDHLEPGLPSPRSRWRLRHRTQHGEWLPARFRRNRSDDDDDDDPPPCPAVIAPAPVRPPFGAEAELEAA